MRPDLPEFVQVIEPFFCQVTNINKAEVKHRFSFFVCLSRDFANLSARISGSITGSYKCPFYKAIWNEVLHEVTIPQNDAVLPYFSSTSKL